MVKRHGIEWDGNGHSPIRHGQLEGKTVARLIKNKNHTRSNDGIWSVEVNGRVLPDTFRYAADAQARAATEIGLL